MDFMADQLFDGRPFRILTVVDCHTRESLAIVPRVSFRAYQVVEVLDEIAKSRGRRACGSTTSYVGEQQGHWANRSQHADLLDRRFR